MASEDEEKVVYLDYNATCPLANEVLEVITEALRDGWANPNSSHAAGRLARGYIEKARAQVGRMINSPTEDIVFTSGGTESNNMVFDSVMRYWRDSVSGREGGDIERRPHVIISNLEHDSIAKTARRLEKDGLAEVTVVEARKETGAVSVDDILAAITPFTVLISIMLAQNETGVLQPVGELVKAVREFEKSSKRMKRIFIHTDAAQALGKVRVDLQTIPVDYLTIVGHKFYGPRNGALYCRGLGKTLSGDCRSLQGAPLYPLLCGGGQERGMRSGTENTGMIVGLGKACELVADNLDRYHLHMRTVRDYLEKKLKDVFGEGVCINCCYGDDVGRLPNTCNFSLLGPRLSGRCVMASLRCSQVSIGAACHSPSEGRPSAVLLASGVERGVAINALRVSVGRDTSLEDIDRFVSDILTSRDKIANESM